MTKLWNMSDGKCVHIRDEIYRRYLVILLHLPLIIWYESFKDRFEHELLTWNMLRPKYILYTVLLQFTSFHDHFNMQTKLSWNYNVVYMQIKSLNIAKNGSHKNNLKHKVHFFCKISKMRRNLIYGINSCRHCRKNI